nr:MAG TPA: hypothetical protein [Caudoviricetes sp.]
MKRKSAAPPPTPVFPRTARSSSPATAPRWTITPTISKAGTIGSLFPCIRTRA